jgi:hypothetical protein
VTHQSKHDEVVRDPVWFKNIRRGGSYAVAIAIGAVLTQLGNIADGVGKVFDRFGTPQAFVVAENSAKSAFSDQLAQRAWRRIFWADNFQARVVAHALISDIDLAWKNYIDADADWNTNVMISIVGLEHYYNAGRRGELETYVLPLFLELDKELGTLRRSEALRALRKETEPTSDQQKEIEGIAKGVEATSDGLKYRLYILVTCFAKGDKQKNFCGDNDSNGSGWSGFWYHLFNRGSG